MVHIQMVIAALRMMGVLSAEIMTAEALYKIMKGRAVVEPEVSDEFQVK